MSDDHPEPSKLDAKVSKQLAKDLHDFWEAETTDWDAQVEGAGAGGSASDLWGCMPVVDSKAVARTAPIFEKHLGIPLDVRLIRPGGYHSIDAMVSDLVPKMVRKGLKRNGSVNTAKEIEA